MAGHTERHERRNVVVVVLGDGELLQKALRFAEQREGIGRLAAQEGERPLQ